MEPEEVLHEHNLKRTGCREGIIAVLTQADQPLSESEIRNRLPGNFDRTTFYRSFKTLLGNGILHRIAIGNQLVKYAIGSQNVNRKNHAHFHCTSCNEIRCLNPVPVETGNIPENYVVLETEVIIKGLCTKCR